MSIYNEIKKAVATTVDVIVDKTTTQAQKSRLVTVMRNEEKIANQIYIELGKYLYSNLREGMPEEIEQLCANLDESKERMSRAQQIYRDVIKQELVNREINKTEAKENFQKIKEPIVTKAKDTVVKVKDTAVDKAVKVKSSAMDTAVKVKDTASEKAEEIKHKANKEVSEEIIEAVEETEIITPNSHDDVPFNKEEIVEPIASDELEKESAEVLTVGQGMNDNVEVIENAIFSDSSLGEDSVAEVEEPREIFSNSVPETAAAPEAEDEEESFVPKTETVEQDFQRNVPVDIITENDFEEDEPEVKPLEKSTPFTKAMKLKNIITKKSTDGN